MLIPIYALSIKEDLPNDLCKVKRNTFLFLVMVVFACGAQQSQVANDPITTEKFQNLITEEFALWNSGALVKEDSCGFIGYIKEYFPKDSIGSPRIIGDLKTYNFTCPFTYFDFCILKKDSAIEPYFYGQFDVYRLKYDYQFPEGKLLAIENPSLNKVLNELLVVDKRSQDASYQKVKELILNLYYTPFFEYKNLSYPTFREAMSTLGYHEDYSADENRNIIRNELTVNPDRLLVLRDDYVGILIFKIQIVDDHILVHEFTLKPKNRIKHFRNHSPPDFEWCR